MSSYPYLVFMFSYPVFCVPCCLPILLPHSRCSYPQRILLFLCLTRHPNFTSNAAQSPLRHFTMQTKVRGV
ncbi:hypothetical protein DFH11DRAFT_1605254 [Phellopilus nigrolimitatus]|nr:hypothetical protein DFH11DRAFT_1605254 [Phellopilus nigrolimitatus]